MISLKQARQDAADVRNELDSIGRQMSAISTAVLKAGRKMTDDERERFVQLTARKEELRDKQIDVDRALVDAESRNEAERTGQPVVDPDAEASRRAALAAGLPVSTDTAASITPLRSGARRFAELFPRAPMTSGAFTSADDFVAAVASGRHDPRLHATTMHGADDPHGGFAVPDVFAARWLDMAVEEEIVRSRATIWPMASRTLTIPMFAANGGANTNGPFGVSAEWGVGESGTEDLTPEQFTLETMTLTAQTLSLYVELSNSLAADGLSFGQQLADAMRKSASWQLDHAFLRGSGVGQPTGILTSGARVTVAKESGQQADTIVYANVTTMLSRLHPASFRSAVWVAHPSTLPQLLALSVPVGTGGSHVPAVLQADGGFTLLTRPLLFSEKASTLGDEGDLMLADFRAYQIGLRADVTLDVSGHVGFRSNKTAFRLTLRIDGQPGVRTPYTLPSGMTSSPFVTLAAR